MAFYSFKLAGLSLLREKWINLLSVITLGAGLLITALTLLSVYNVNLATQALPEKFSVMLYLRDNLPETAVDKIIAVAEKEYAVEKITFIPRHKALAELRETLRDTSYILEGLGENPLPDSIEIKLKSLAVNPDTVKKLSDSLKKLDGVSEIEYGEKFLSSIYSLRFGVETMGIVLIVIMAVGMLFVCYTTVKILFYRREREIETYKLLGATKSFIRAPFFIEGALIGLLGGMLSLVGILLLYYLIILKLSLAFPIFHGIVFPVRLSFFLPLVGIFLGITGAAIAIGRIRY